MTTTILDYTSPVLLPVELGSKMPVYVSVTGMQLPSDLAAFWLKVEFCMDMVAVPMFVKLSFTPGLRFSDRSVLS